MPKVIATAVIEATKKIGAAEATGAGEDGARLFKYSTINDVLKVANDALNDVGLTAIPIEVEYGEEVVSGPVPQVWARYGYRFRLIFKDGTSWIDDQDTRHVSVLMSSDGMGTGKAQSLALRDYYRGLLRIRTGEAEELNAQNVSRETIQRSPSHAKKDAILFDFGRGLVPIVPADIKAAFDDQIVGLKLAQRKQWEAANATGLRELHDQAKPIWLHIRKGLDQS